MPRPIAFFCLMIILFASSLALAAEQAGDNSPEAKIRQTLAVIQDSFNRGDAKSLAACWTPEGEFIGPKGERIIGREKIEGAFQEFLKNHPNAKLRLGIASWRLVTDDVALVDLLSEMTPVPKGIESEPASSAVFVQRDGKWLVGSMHETAGSAPGHRLHLKNLQWLVGEWAEHGGDTSILVPDAENDDDAPNVSVRSACDWNASGNYLIRKFSVDRSNGPSFDGTEIIGWDPRQHRIRSWTFNSDGGFGESAWTRDGERWIITHTGTLPDGGDLSATYIVTPVDADAITVATKDHRINGEPQPALPEIKLKRHSDKIAPKSPPMESPKQVLP